MNAFEEVGYWSEIKLDIIKEYAHAYSTIMAAQTRPRFYHVYVDAFAGAGVHISRETREFVPGSPLNALHVTPPFREYYFIDIKRKKVKSLEDLAGERADVHIFHGDCNEILLTHVFPQVRYEDRRRALCLLDPNGLHLDWKVIQAAGQARSIEVFLNFPVADMNRNVLWRATDRVDQNQSQRLSRYWGDDSWRNVAYRSELNLFEVEQIKMDNETIAHAFRDRLRSVAGFAHVPEPIPMRNKNRAIIYYLVFASPKPVAAKIVSEIFNKYRERQR